MQQILSTILFSGKIKKMSTTMRSGHENVPVENVVIEKVEILEDEQAG